MKRLSLVLLLIALAAAVIIVLMLRHKQLAATAGVAALLPADTAVLIHIPDLEANRDAWQRTDLYQLYHEPAVQEFLRKPKAPLAKNAALKGAWQDAASLRIRDAFLATTSFDSLRLIGGFEFRCSEAEARSVLDRWKATWVAAGAQRSATNHGNHAIEIFSAPRFLIASAVVDHRFFAAMNLDDLKSLLDRVDGRAKGGTLAAQENFRAAMKQMPAGCAVLFYLQPQQLAQKLVALRAQNGRPVSAAEKTLIERMQSISHAIVFDQSKLRDVSFAAMPRLLDTKIKRETLEATSPDTLFYLAALVNLREQMAGLAAAPSSPLTTAGVSLEDWQAGFGDELSMLAEWPAASRMPSVVATLGVRDPARARKVAAALAGSSGWQHTRRGEADIFTAPASGVVLMRMVAAVSDKQLAVGLDAAAVERTVSPPANAHGLASVARFREASRLVPEPQQMFAWLDLSALYARLDATLRPLLQISAAFMPDASERLDVNKLPPAEVVTKHLGPVVASQWYVDGGYRSESVGSITLGQAVVLALTGYAGSQIFQKHGDVFHGWRMPPAPTVSPSSASPAITPGSTP